ncbi:MAG: hypothetical protein GY938_25720 [Ketobacter sp.]|nr:hypothetical protein [Ketobacter sp.]
MANVAYGKFIYGMRDIKITNLAGTLQEDLDAAVKLLFTLDFEQAELKGDDVIKAVKNFPISATGELEAGGYSSAAMSIMLGKTLTTVGSSPNESTTLQIDAGDSMPYFKVYGKALDDVGGDLHIYAMKAQVTEIEFAGMEGENWSMTSCTIKLLDDGSNGIAQFVQNETAVALPSS